MPIVVICEARIENAVSDLYFASRIWSLEFPLISKTIEKETTGNQTAFRFALDRQIALCVTTLPRYEMACRGLGSLR